MSAYQLYNTTLSIEALEVSAMPSPVVNILKYQSFPQSARQRELAKEATKFAANAIHLFCHHTTPVLESRRGALTVTGTRRKKYHKSADLIWRALPHDQSFFWEHHAKLIRQALKDGTLTAEQCLQDAGFHDEWWAYRRFAEMAVADYLELPMPEYVEEAPRRETSPSVEAAAPISSLSEFDADALASAMSKMQAKDDALQLCRNHPPNNPMDDLLSAASDSGATLSKDPMDLSHCRRRSISATERLGHFANETPPPRSPSQNQLLNTLPEPFGPVTSRMIYGNFVQLYPYAIVRNAATGKHITALLRQLADLLDPTGKEFFYYYAYPHLWKSIKPTEVDERISAVAHSLWQFMEGADKESWQRASGDAKRLLGDGDLAGLTRLELESRDSEVSKLHDMMRKVLREGKMRRGEIREMAREEDDVLDTE